MQISLRLQLGLTLFLAVATFLAVDHGLRSRAFAEDFAALESTEYELEAERARASLARSSQALSRLAQRIDLAESTSQLEPNALRPDIVLVLDSSGAVLRREVLDPETGNPLALREIPNERLSPNHPILCSWREQLCSDGLFASERGILIIGSEERSVNGSAQLVVVAQFLTDERLRSLHVEAGIEFDVFAVRAADGTEFLSPAASAAVGSGAVFFETDESGATQVYASVDDVRGLPLFGVRLEPGVSLWARLERYALLTSFAVALLFPLVLLVLLQLVVTGPLARLTSLASAIGASDDATLRTRMDRRDEIGTLSRTFDGMLDEIERARTAETRTARVVGRSEVAVSVMHNVGNLVNSAQVSAALLRDSTAKRSSEDLSAILGAIVDHADSLDGYLSTDPQGRHLLDYFAAVLADLRAAEDVRQQESGQVLEGVERIARLVRSLTGDESKAEQRERVDLGAEVRHALDVVLGDSPREFGIELELALGDVGPRESKFVHIDRQRLHEVLVVLLSNARDAVTARAPGERRLRIDCVDAGEDRVRISISDNGDGVPPAARAEIFALGFSTKDEGSGLGLHLASLAAAELGGSVTLASSALIGGATFVVELIAERETPRPSRGPAPPTIAA